MFFFSSPFIAYLPLHIHLTVLQHFWFFFHFISSFVKNILGIYFELYPGTRTDTKTGNAEKYSELVWFPSASHSEEWWHLWERSVGSLCAVLSFSPLEGCADLCCVLWGGPAGTGRLDQMTLPACPILGFWDVDPKLRIKINSLK